MAQVYLEDVLGANGGVMPTGDSAKTVASSDTAIAAAATAVTITMNAPGSGVANVISGIVASYSSTPTGGALTITDNGTTVFQLDLVGTGPFVIPFHRPKKFTVNTNTVVTLASGGGTVVGKLNLTKWTE